MAGGKHGNRFIRLMMRTIGNSKYWKSGRIACTSKAQVTPEKLSFLAWLLRGCSWSGETLKRVSLFDDC